MKVEFAQEEAQALAQFVLDQVLALPLSRADAAALRRFGADELRPGSATLLTLAERINADLQRTHDAAHTREIMKPDWL